MIVLHILGILLKIIGILLLLALGVLLLGLFCILIFPVKYRIQGKKEEEGIAGSARISWLFHIVSVRLAYEEEQGLTWSIRLFGISLQTLQKFLQNRKNRRRKRKTKKASKKNKQEVLKQEIQEKEDLRVDTEMQKEALEKEQPEEHSPEPEARAEKKQARKLGIWKAWVQFWRRLLAIPGKLRSIFRNFQLTVKKICGTIKNIRAFLEEEAFQRGKKHVFSEVKKLLKRMRPKKIEGNLKFGAQDPCITGEILAAAGIFYPLYGEHFTIEPYFDQCILQGNVFLKGHVRGMYFLLLVWSLLWDRDIRYLIKKILKH